MNFNAIRKMAKDMDISTYRMKKPDIIRAIQKKENNPECYGTLRIQDCDEFQCLWRNDCVTHNGGWPGR